VGLEISSTVRHKLATKHSVTEIEIIECFSSRELNKKFLTDDREDNQTNPPTLWFIGETDSGRILKVVFIYNQERFIIKTSYEANENEKRIYAKHA